MQRIRLFLFSAALLLALFGATTFTESSTAFASTVQQQHSVSHSIVLPKASGGKGAVHTARGSHAQASCSGTGCSGQDPEKTGCEAGAYTVQTAVFSNSYVELRYSPTCKTNWGEVVSKVGPTDLVIRTQRIDGLTYTFAGGKYNYAFSAMVYAPTVAARACGGVNSISGCTAYV